MPSPRSARLKKELTLFDVYAISTGAMFSSGFFLLPGLAAAQAGPSVVVAYLLAGVLILPAMLSQAELATAMPRAGGTYYFLDRSLGPLAGTVGGLGTWLALVLKSAFALVGMGAYLAFFVDVPIKPLAVALTVAFMAVNVVGAKETTGLQRLLVVVLLSVLAFFVAQGLFEVGATWGEAETRGRFEPFAPFGLGGVLGTVGFVFVSYAGLTKVASVAEEVRDPDRNIPLGMALSLLTATVVYVVGVFIIVAVLEPTALYDDLTPVATAGAAFFDWLPGEVGLVLIVAAAVAAFASTGNAGLMSASRYPLAMARDRLLPEGLAHLGRFRTPTRAILLTAALMVLCIVALDEAGIAKLASAFQLFIFMLVNFAVIVMRESRITSYDPGYRSPLYPWMQVAGILVPIVLIGYMGWMAVLFTVGMVVACLAWFARYARGRVVRDGAIYHWFERLGRRRFEGLDPELRTILKEKGLRDEDPFEEVIARADVLDLGADATFEAVAAEAARRLEARVPGRADEIEAAFLRGTRVGATPVAHGVALPHIRVAGLARPELVLARSRTGLSIPVPADAPALPGADEEPVQVAHALFFLVSPEEHPRQHLRILAQIAGRADEDLFLAEWNAAGDEGDLQAILLRDQRFHSLHLAPGTPAAALAGRALRDAGWPEGCLVALIRRADETVVPGGGTVLEPGDRLTIIGSREGIAAIRARYRPDGGAAGDGQR
ncbi:MAG: amino acid permease [Rhodothermales bacterium]|nr:amino acid permease [Rhodothermales bacterium]